MALILSINEEKDALALTERLLTAGGHEVISFEKVEEGVEWLKDHQPDLVLTSGGKYREKAGRQVDLLKQSGVPGAKIVLLIGKGSLLADHPALEKKVCRIFSEASDIEILLPWIDSGLGALPESRQVKSKIKINS
jgi:DNA-binding NtrC family response regulator